MKFEVWTEIGDGVAIRYQGVQRIVDKQYFIVNGYRFYDPINLKCVLDSDEIFTEIFNTMMSEKSLQWYGTLEQAIEMYNREFSIP